MAIEDWNASTNPKVQGSWNLHTLLPRGLDFFINLSSVSGILGAVGQSNYAAENTYEDALAHHRIMRGEKAISLDLGWIAEVGAVAESEYLQKGFAATGFMMPISQKDLLGLLDYCCDPNLPLATPLLCRAVVGVNTPAAIRAKGVEEPGFMREPTYRAMQQMGLTTDVSLATESSGKYMDFAALFTAATSLHEAGSIVVQGLTKRLSKALSMSAEDIDASKPLHVYGVDSLLAVELRNWFAKELSADVAVFDIMGGVSTAGVGVTVAGKSGFRGWGGKNRLVNGCYGCLRISEAFGDGGLLVRQILEIDWISNFPTGSLMAPLEGIAGEFTLCLICSFGRRNNGFIGMYA